MALPRDVVILFDEQFGKLVELLTPGFECAKLMLADYQRQADERAQYDAAIAGNAAIVEKTVDDRTPEQIAADEAGRHNGLE